MQDYKKSRNWIRRKNLKTTSKTVKFCIERKRREECQAKTKPGNRLGEIYKCLLQGTA